MRIIITITHGTRKVKLFSTGPKSTHEVIMGYYLVWANMDQTDRIEAAGERMGW